MHEPTSNATSPTAGRPAASPGRAGASPWPMAGLLLLPLLVFAAFGVDLASWYARISALQRAADAPPLAGAVWMPDLDTARTEAEDSLLTNELHTDSDPAIARSTRTRLDADRAAGDRHRQRRRPPLLQRLHATARPSLTRYAEAEYNLPLPLGSPLNYFGGDATPDPTPAPATTWSVAWPSDYRHRGVPANPGRCNLDCHVTANSASGRWAGSPPTYRPRPSPARARVRLDGRRAGATRHWRPPPPDYCPRAPTNGPCNGCRSTNGPARRYGAGGHRHPGPFSHVADRTATLPAARGPTRRRFALHGALVRHRRQRQRHRRPRRTGRDGWATGPRRLARALGLRTGPRRPFAGAERWPGGRQPAVPLVGRVIDTTADAGRTRSTPTGAPASGPPSRARRRTPTTATPTAPAATSTGTTCAAASRTPSTSRPSEHNRGILVRDRDPCRGSRGTVAVNDLRCQLQPGRHPDTPVTATSTGSGSGFTTRFQMYEQTNLLDFSVRSALVVNGTPRHHRGQLPLGRSTNPVDASRAVAPPVHHHRRPARREVPAQRRTSVGGTTGAGINGYAIEAVANGSHDGHPAGPLRLRATWRCRTTTLLDGCARRRPSTWPRSAPSTPARPW